MIYAAFVQRMARYNRWQNENLYTVADRLSDAERRLERGAFFGSIHATLNHLLWADRTWMARFSDWPKPAAGIPQSVSLFPDWDNLKRERADSDAKLIVWADALDPTWIAGDLTWFSGAIQREVTKPRWQLLTHFFNHQTHHRGQVHAMLTQAGGKPHDTDLFVMPE
jgi:uncharacterized damage-inducible protein DinB